MGATFLFPLISTLLLYVFVQFRTKKSAPISSLYSRLKLQQLIRGARAAFFPLPPPSIYTFPRCSTPAPKTFCSRDKKINISSENRTSSFPPNSTCVRRGGEKEGRRGGWELEICFSLPPSHISIPPPPSRPPLISRREEEEEEVSAPYSFPA